MAEGNTQHALESFHPVLAQWFRERVGEPSAPQERGWPKILSGRNVLLAAPTGSGKTLSAFMACLDELFREAIEGTLPDEVRVLYVSPLKALGNDVQKNLLEPLAEIAGRARAKGLDPQEIRVLVRSGDTPAKDRARMVRRPPHVLITTPESLYLLLTAEKSRALLRSVRTVVVDEIHALARDKRGSHFALSMERLKALVERPIQLVGLSATQKPIERFARFLTGAGATCEVVQIGHVRPWEISIETPDDELGAVATHEQWGQVYDRLVDLVGAHRTTLVFANTRRLAERVAHDLGERLGPAVVGVHHGSVAKEARLAAEEKLKAGALRVMVATASLELGLDVGSVDLVVQLGSPRNIATLLQRVGRAGHRNDLVSKGILIALTRDELVECAAILRAVKEGTLDAVRPPDKPLDVLAQQIVAACAAEDWSEEALFALVRRADPYGTLGRAEFDGVVQMLADGVATRRGRARALLHRDRVHGRLRARRGARTAAIFNGGAIPDTFAVQVVAEPEGRVVGTVDEDFATESMAGDVFALGTTSWRVRSLRGGKLSVEDASGTPPTIPFWIAEAPSRTPELSHEVARLRRELAQMADPRGFLERELGLREHEGSILVRYLAAGARALGGVPSETLVIAERFFDEAGGMQLVLHAPFGGRVNRAWGLALRKRFCRTFDFELQAAATDDAILLSLGEQHSFPLEDIFTFVTARNVNEALTQAVLQTPLFPTRFRWNATRALLLERMSTRGRVPPILQRARNEDLLSAVFPAQTMCQDNMGGGDIELPDHPLVASTVHDCLHEAMDLDGLREVLEGLKSGRIRTLARDVPEPSPFAHAILNSAPYTFLDGAPLEERRARAVSLRRALPAEDAAAFGALDAAAIARVIDEARPPMRDADEAHDALLSLGIARADAFAGEHLEALVAEGRAARVGAFAVSRERAQWAHALLGGGPEPLPGDPPIGREDAIVGVVRGHMEICGPTTDTELARALALPESEVRVAQHRLEGSGEVLRGRFRPDAPAGVLEWCDRRLLQRIHRLTVGRLRAEIQPVTAQDFMRFLLRWHHLDGHDGRRGRAGVVNAVTLLEGWEAPASAWEHGLIDRRVERFDPDDLARACLAGDVVWGRLASRERAEAYRGPPRGAGNVRQRTRPTRSALLTFVTREHLPQLLSAARRDGAEGLPEGLSAKAIDVAAALERRGALFFRDLVAHSKRLPAEVEEVLWELLARGVVTADDVENLRVLRSPERRRRQQDSARGGPGRWSLLRAGDPPAGATIIEHLAMLFLRRYGIVWRDLAVREPLAPPWRELLAAYRRLEARGQVRGGRFVAGFTGEQFALPEAVDAARAVRRGEVDRTRITITATDPLNLTGIVTPGARVPAIAGHWISYESGVPVDPDAPPPRPPGRAMPAQRPPKERRHPFAAPR